MFSKIFSKSQKTKSEVRRETGKQQHQQQQTSSSSSLETSPHHMYHPLQLRQQYPQLYPHYNNLEQHKSVQQLSTTASTATSTTATATSLESLFHPSKLVTNLSESPGRSRKLRRQYDNIDGEVAVDNNLQNESTEQKQRQQQQQQANFFQREDRTCAYDVATTTTSRANVTYDCCHGNETAIGTPQQQQQTTGNNMSSFNVTVQQCLTNSPIYNFPSTTHINKSNVMESQFSTPLTVNSLINISTKSPTSFRNCSQQDLQHFDLLQQQQQQQQQQLQQQHSEKEAKFFPVRYRSLSAGDHTTFAIENSDQGKDAKNTSSRWGRWGSESEEKWGGRAEKVKGGGGGGVGMMWGSSRKHIPPVNQTSTPKSTSSEQFYRSIIGQVFLICGKEMKRCVLLQKIGSLDAVRQIFSQAFSDVVKVQEFYGQDPLLTIYILDTVAAVFYELEDYREVRNLSVLKIFEKRPRNETHEKKKSPKKKTNKMAVDGNNQTNVEIQELNSHLGSVQSLPPPSPRPEMDVLKMKSREVCCFGGVVGYQKQPKTVLANSKHSSLESGVGANSQYSPAIEVSTSVSTGAPSTKTNSDVCQSKQYHSLDRYHTSGCHHKHHHHHRSHKKTKAGTQSASASPSSDYYSQYSLYGSHCSCCRHHCNCDAHLQKCRHQHQPAVQSPPSKQPKSPLKTSQQRHTWTGHQPFCHNSFRSPSDPKGTGSNSFSLPVDLLNTATCLHSMSEVASTTDGQGKVSASTNEMETRLRIRQLEEQLASLTQWVQNSIEAESSGHASKSHKAYTQGSVGQHTSPSGLEMDRNQTLHTIQCRLSGMLQDVAHLKDQCQHLKLAHQVQRQEVHEALAFFSQKIISCIKGGVISEDVFITSLAQSIATFEFNKGSESTDNQEMLEATRAELLRYGHDDPYAETESSTPTAEGTSRNTQGKVQHQSKSIKRLTNSAPPTGAFASSHKNRESTHSPDLVRSNRGGETEATPNSSSKSDPLNSTEFYEEENSSDIWISMKNLKKLSTH